MIDRIEELEELLDVPNLVRFSKGESLEKYRTILNDLPVIIRIYDDDYYTNRFLREGVALRSVKTSEKIIVPKIVDEWPEYKIRALEWITITSESINQEEEKMLFDWLKSQNKHIPFDLKSDLVKHLSKTETIHPAYREFFLTKLQIIRDNMDWCEHTNQLVHGDFHSGNVAKSNEQLVIFDWEYTTWGSKYYDMAYFALLSDTNLTVPKSWSALVTAVITHWYIQEDQFSPKEALKWIEKLDKIVLSLDK